MQTAEIDVFLARAGLSGSARTSDTREQVAFVVERLGLARGSRLLDLPCGNGRHAALLARRGYHVLGVDVSRACIALARAESAHPRVTYRSGDVRTATSRLAPVDGVISLLSCLGYFADEAADRRAAAALLAPLRSGGRLVLSTANREVVARAGGSSRFETGRYAIERHERYEPEHRCLERRFVVRDHESGRRRTIRQRRRLYSHDEVLELLGQAGVTVDEVHADFRGARFDPRRSAHAVYVGTRRGDGAP